MHRVVSRSLGTALLAVALTAAGALPAVADAPRRPSQADAVAAGGFTPLTPSRLLDTRTTAAVGPGAALTLPVSGRGGVPNTGVAAVVLNVTAVSPTAEGYLSVYPGPSRPGSSTLNFVPGQTVANLVVAPVRSDGTVQIFNSAGSTQVLADVSGWFAPTNGTPVADGAFAPVGPARLLDTRSSTAIPAGGTRTLQVAGSSAVPAVAGAAVLNVTAVGAGSAGYLSLYPGSTAPTSSNVNFAAGQTVAGLSAVQLADDGTVTIRNGSTTPLQVIVDVSGWFRGTTARTTGAFSFLTPARLLDTRVGTGSVRAPIPAGQSRSLQVDGRGGVPTDGVAAVVLTVTATNTGGPGYLTVFPGTTAPNASTLNFVAGRTVANLVVVPVQNGAVSILNGSAQPVDVIADVAGLVRSTNLLVPDTGTSHYIRNLAATQTPAQLTAAGRAIGAADGAGASTSSPQVVLLQFGAQTDKAGGDGSGTGTGATALGIRQTNTNIRLTYAQVVAAVQGYLAGYQAALAPGATNPVTVAVGTSSSGFEGASYLPAAKGKDWANLVVEPLVSYAARATPGITVVAGNDIEANFDAQISEVEDWITSYLGAGPNALINNGAAAGCPSGLNQTGMSCSPVPVEQSDAVHTWTQADYVKISAGLGVGRISVLPQIYFADNAAQWENIALTAAAARTPLKFAGVLTSVSACAPPGSMCSSIDPDDAWTLMTQALDSNSVTAPLVVPAVSDITVNS